MSVITTLETGFTESGRQWSIKAIDEDHISIVVMEMPEGINTFDAETVYKKWRAAVISLAESTEESGKTLSAIHSYQKISIAMDPSFLAKELADLKQLLQSGTLAKLAVVVPEGLTGAFARIVLSALGLGQVVPIVNSMDAAIKALKS